MPLLLPGLDQVTRAWMLREFEAEEERGPYRSKLFSPQGHAAFPDLMRAAIVEGDDATLAAALSHSDYWLPTEAVGTALDTRRVNPHQAARRLAQIEFNTWYVHGFAARLMSEGVVRCKVVRARDRSWDPECPSHDGAVVPVAAVYDGHRVRYWPTPQPGAFSIPTSPGCGHSITRA